MRYQLTLLTLSFLLLLIPSFALAQQAESSQSTITFTADQFDVDARHFANELRDQPGVIAVAQEEDLITVTYSEALPAMLQSLETPTPQKANASLAEATKSTKQCTAKKAACTAAPKAKIVYSREELKQFSAEERELILEATDLYEITDSE